MKRPWNGIWPSHITVMKPVEPTLRPLTPPPAPRSAQRTLWDKMQADAQHDPVLKDMLDQAVVYYNLKHQDDSKDDNSSGAGGVSWGG